MKTETTVLFIVDGMEYPLDIADLTGREVGVLKRVGHLGGVSEIAVAMEAGDIEALVALVGIAMSRAGLKPNYERLLDLPMGQLAVKLPEADADPLAPGTAGIPSSPGCTA